VHPAGAPRAIRPHPGLRPADRPFTRDDAFVRDDPVDGWARHHGPQQAHPPVDARDAFGLRTDERPIPSVVSREPPRFDPTSPRTRVAPERRVRFVEMRSADERVAPPPTRRSGLRRAASIAALLVIAAGAGAGWVLMESEGGLPFDLSLNLPLELPSELPFALPFELPFDQVASVDDARSDLPLRASEAAPTQVPAAQEADDASDNLADPPVPIVDQPPSERKPDPVLSSDLITEMKISEPRATDGVPASDPGPLPAPIDPPAASDTTLPEPEFAVTPEPEIAATPEPVEPPAIGPSSIPDSADAQPADAGADVSAAELRTAPDPADEALSPAADPSPGEDQIAAIVAATIEPPRPRLRPDGLVPPAPTPETDIVATTAPPAGEETLPPVSGLAPDFAPTGSLPEPSVPAAGAGPVDEPGRTVGRTVIGRIIPPAEMNARIGSGNRRVVGRIIPPEEFAPAGAAPAAQPGPIPPLDVGVTPFAESLADETFDTETDSITTEGPFADIGGGAGDRRVVVHVPRSEIGTMDEAVSAIPGKVEVRVVDIRPDADMVRYYYAEDRDAALALRRELAGAGGDAGAVGISDFTNYRPRPRRGLIEVWLSDRR
jgi:hypothetical protein